MAKVTYLTAAKKRDPIKGLILEYQKIYKLSNGQLAERLGVSRTTFCKRMKEMHSDEWLGDAKKLCRSLDIPIDEFRAAVRY